MSLGDTELLWTLLGRGPAVAVLVALVLHARRVMGLKEALLGLSGFCAGAVVGTAVLPSVLGAMGGGVLGAIGTWWALGARMPGPALPTAALVGLMAVGRLGCFLGGCCFGRTTDSAFAVRYPSGSLAHLLHHALGWVGAGEPARPVVPVQLYESLGMAGLLLAFWLARRRLRHEGAWSLAMVGGVLVLRAAVDPLRAMVNTASSARILGPASAFQWGALAAAAACVGLAVVLERRASPRVQARSVARGPGWMPGALWGLQAASALALHHEGIWLLRVLAVGSLAASGAVLLHSLPARAGLRWSLGLAGAVALVPLVPRAAPDAPTAGHVGWVYGVVPRVGLVRLGPGTTSDAVLAQRHLALLQSEPSAAEDESEAGAAPLSRGEEAAPEEAEAPRRRRRVALNFMGGRTSYTNISCNGDSTIIQSFGEMGGQYEQELDDGNVLQFHARGLLTFTDGTAVRTPTWNGVFLGGAFHEWVWPDFSLGVGGSVGVAGSPDLYPVTLLVPPTSLDRSARILLWPMLYLRVEAIRGWAWELGTGSRFQPADGPFSGFRFGRDEAGAFSGRLGFQVTTFPRPLATAQFYGSLGIPIGSRWRVEARVQGLPAEVCAGCGPNVSGGVRVEHEF